MTENMFYFGAETEFPRTHATPSKTYKRADISALSKEFKDYTNTITVGSVAVKLDGLSDYEKENLIQMAESSKQLQQEITRLKLDISYCRAYYQTDDISKLSANTEVQSKDKNEGTYEQACKEYEQMLKTADELQAELSEMQLKILSATPTTKSNYYAIRKALEERKVQEGHFSESSETKSADVNIDNEEIVPEIQQEFSVTDEPKAEQELETEASDYITNLNEKMPEDSSEEPEGAFDNFKYNTESANQKSPIGSKMLNEETLIQPIAIKDESIEADKPELVDDIQESKENKITNDSNAAEETNFEKEEVKAKEKIKQNNFSIKKTIKKAANLIFKYVKTSIEIIKEYAKILYSLVKNLIRK